MGFYFLPSGLHPPGLALAEEWQKPPLSLLRRYYSEKSEESKAPKNLLSLVIGRTAHFFFFLRKGQTAAPAASTKQTTE